MAKDLLKPITVLNAKPADKDIRLNDGDGLYLLIKPNGAKWWRLDYSIEGKRKTLSLGVYPVTGLADARHKAEEARANVANGIDPSDTRKELKANLKLTAHMATTESLEKHRRKPVSTSDNSKPLPIKTQALIEKLSTKELTFEQVEILTRLVDLFTHQSS